MANARHIMIALIAFGAAASAPPAVAAPCAGFTDVDDSSPFCSSVEWVRNQGITLGCGTGSTYCPDEAVSRLAMAAFLKRFGDAGSGQPYAYSTAPNCPFTNLCEVIFPAVPAGKRLHVTNVRALFRYTNAAAVLAVNATARGNLLIAFPLAPFSGAYYGTLISANIPVDLVFAAGESPNLELGIASGAGGIAIDPANRLGVTGYLVNAVP